jgi:hypothetical protein
VFYKFAQAIMSDDVGTIINKICYDEKVMRVL